MSPTMCPSDAVTLIRLVECVHCTETQIACVACSCLRSTHATQHRTRLIRKVSSWATEARTKSPLAILVVMMAAVTSSPVQPNAFNPQGGDGEGC